MPAVHWRMPVCQEASLMSLENNLRRQFVFIALNQKSNNTEHNSQHKDRGAQGFTTFSLVVFGKFSNITCHTEKIWIIRSCVLDMNPSPVITDGYQTEVLGRELDNFILNSRPNMSALQFILSKTISSLY